MIVEWMAAPFLAMWDLLLSALPDVEWTPPESTAMVQRLAEIDSVIPIGPVLQLAIGMLTFLVAFFAIRFALIVWKALPFT